MHLETRIETPAAPQGLHDLANQLIGASPRMGTARALIAKVAANESTVLITGESGTGKELAARAIHNLSCRREQASFQ